MELVVELSERVGLGDSERLHRRQHFIDNSIDLGHLRLARIVLLQRHHHFVQRVVEPQCLALPEVFLHREVCSVLGKEVGKFDTRGNKRLDDPCWRQLLDAIQRLHSLQQVHQQR